MSTGIPERDSENEQGGKKPVNVISYPVGKDSWIQVSIWKRQVTTGEKPFHVFDLSLRKRMKIDGQFKSFYSFRASEIPLILRAFERAEGWILDQPTEQGEW